MIKSRAERSGFMEDIRAQRAVMRAWFDDVKSVRLPAFLPKLDEPSRKEEPETAADADAGDEVTRHTHALGICSVIPMCRVVEGDLHEFAEFDRTTLG